MADQVVPGSSVHLTEEQRVELRARQETAEFEADVMRGGQAADADTQIAEARAARERGDAFFEAEFDVRDASGVAPWLGSKEVERDSTRRDTRVARMNVLAAIEREGWRLVHTDYVYVQLGELSRDKFPATGQHTTVRGTVIQFALFRESDPAVRPDDHNGS